MADPNAAHNNLESPIRAQIEPSEANTGGEALPKTWFTPQQRLTCISCDVEAASFSAPCKHSYCDECLASYVKSALEPDGAFPPACCNLPITLQSARAHLHHDLVKRYEEKHLEIVASCSMVCAQSGCCVVIPPEKIVDGLGHCLACNNYMCTKCRMQAHKKEPCPTDAEHVDLMKLAKKQGWQTCYRCNNMIELNFGCNHMTCICRAQFCYVCGMMWKKCSCPQYNNGALNDDHLEGQWNDAGIGRERVATGNLPRYRPRTIFRAERAVERYNKFLWQTWGRQDPRPREEQIQEVRDEVENGCDHGYWRLVERTKKEPGHCKLCKYVGHKHIYQCLFCPLTSCRACHTDEPPEYRLVEGDEQQGW